jgi:hypothetical protein
MFMENLSMVARRGGEEVRAFELLAVGVVELWSTW